MPCNPRKCWGKNVRFTPTNMIKNCAWVHRSGREVPVMVENQKVTPAKMAKTAPMERT